MRRRLFVTGGCLLMLASLAALGHQLDPFLAADACAGSGGSFDFARGACDFGRAHAYAAFPMWSFWASLAGTWAGLTLFGLATPKRRRRRMRFDADGAPSSMRTWLA